MAHEFIDVLVVDDEPVIRFAVGTVLRAMGLGVATAVDCKSALAHPAADACRLVICDLILPDGSGVDVIRELKRRRPGLPILVISGYATPEQESRVLQAGATSFLPKPFDETELVHAVHGALGSDVALAEEEKP